MAMTRFVDQPQALEAVREIMRLEDKIEAVRTLHRGQVDPFGWVDARMEQMTGEPQREYCVVDGERYPCRTVRMLGKS